MSTLRTKIGTGVTLAALGGLSAYAVASQPTDASPTAPKAASVEVRTQVERRVVHKTRHAKPKRSAAVASQSGPGGGSSGSSSSGPSPSSGPGPAPAAAASVPSSSGPPPTTHSGGADDGPGHDVGDDHGGLRPDAGDDHGGDDSSGHGGDGGGEDNSGHGGGGDDD